MGEYADLTFSGYLGTVKPRRRPMCNRCKSFEVFWQKLPEGGRLYDRNGKHTCQPSESRP